ncbi:hypothetical protein ABZW11_41370 [Nonomuraea sp. NPDC004580]|uniref:hypothetical protein n=1 Tax=Nonomuraea sp. NPDC004580 TaxID=3154552 RepID=UPI0033B28739
MRASTNAGPSTVTPAAFELFQNEAADALARLEQSFPAKLRQGVLHGGHPDAVHVGEPMQRRELVIGR